MYFRRFIIIIFFVITTSYISFAQFISLNEYKGEYGAGVGTTTYFGQIGGATKTYRTNFNLYFRKILTQKLSVRINYEYLPLGANDSLSKNIAVKQRGFNFYRPFHELSFLLEYFFENQNPLQVKYNKITPYAGIGMGYILNVPKDYNNFKTYKFDYEKIQDQYLPIFTVPINVGVKYISKNNLHLFSEITYRFTSSDKIDNFGDGEIIDTKNGTFKSTKNTNDRIISVKMGVFKTILNKY